MEPTHSWGPPHPEQLGWTLDRHILERQRSTPDATGDFTGLFQPIALFGANPSGHESFTCVPMRILIP